MKKKAGLYLRSGKKATPNDLFWLGIIFMIVGITIYFVYDMLGAVFFIVGLLSFIYGSLKR